MAIVFIRKIPATSENNGTFRVSYGEWEWDKLLFKWEYLHGAENAHLRHLQVCLATWVNPGDIPRGQPVDNWGVGHTSSVAVPVSTLIRCWSCSWFSWMLAVSCPKTSLPPDHSAAWKCKQPFWAFHYLCNYLPTSNRFRYR